MSENDKEEAKKTVALLKTRHWRAAAPVFDDPPADVSRDAPHPTPAPFCTPTAKKTFKKLTRRRRHVERPFKLRSISGALAAAAAARVDSHQKMLDLIISSHN